MREVRFLLCLLNGWCFLALGFHLQAELPNGPWWGRAIVAVVCLSAVYISALLLNSAIRGEDDAD